MRAKITLVLFIILGVLLCSIVGIQRSSDFIYFPEQAEYIKRAIKCPTDQILWPGNGRCYKEGERGPCNVGRVIAFDQRLLKPYCLDDF